MMDIPKVRSVRFQVNKTAFIVTACSGRFRKRRTLDMSSNASAWILGNRPILFSTSSQGFSQRSQLHFEKQRELLPREYFRRAHPVASKSTSISVGARIFGGLLVFGIVLTAFLPFADVLKGDDKTTAMLDSQLRGVPVFTVTDSTGRPFLSETEDRSMRRGFFFVQPSDADKYLETVRAESEDSKVLAISLDEAIKFLDSHKSSLKSVPEKFDIFPDDHEVALAQELTQGAFQKSFGENAIPLFYIDGLGVKNNEEEPAVYPLFFEKEKLDQTVSDLKRKDPSAALNLKELEVIDLKQTIKEIKAGSNPRLNRVVFVPLTDSLEKLKATQQ